MPPKPRAHRRLVALTGMDGMGGQRGMGMPGRKPGRMSIDAGGLGIGDQ